MNLDLTACDKEPIHIIGGVQPHGAFLAFRLNDKTIYHVSNNCEEWFAEPLTRVLNRRIDEVLPESSAQKILALAAEIKGTAFEFTRIPALGKKNAVIEVLVYALDGLIAVEFEGLPAGAESLERGTAHSHKRSLAFVEDLHASSNLVSAAKSVCRAIRSLTGFERVMMYRYLPSWDGEVIAEDKVPEAHSFLHHRFPATDIPLPARELYLKNRTRLIADSAATAVSIEPPHHYLTRKPIDLSHSKLRAVSPVHLEYLKNMKVKASFSVAVIVEDQLWGLIACHGRESTVLPHEIRLSCETLASTFAVIALMSETLEKRSMHLEFEERLRKIIQDVRLSPDPVARLMSAHEELGEAFGATGIGLVNRSGTEIAGLTPPLEQTRAIADWLRERFEAEHRNILSIDSLGAVKSEWSALKDLACGVLAVHSPGHGDSVLMFFRPRPFARSFGAEIRARQWINDSIKVRSILVCLLKVGQKP